MKVSCELSIVGKATGSARFTSNGTTAFCIVNGPSDQQGQFRDTALLEVKWFESTILKNRILEKYFSDIMISLLSNLILTDLDPFKTICIEIHIVDSCRNTLFCAINACFLALASAGIPLKGSFCATTSFTLEEEVFLYFETRICYKHAFGEIKEEVEKNALDNIPEIQENLFFAIKNKVIPPQK